MRKLLNDLKCDLEVYSAGISKYKLFIYPDFLVVLNYRLGNFLSRKKLGFLGKFFWYLNRIIFSVDINEKCKLSGGLKIVHGIGIVIGAKVQSEKNLTVYQGVTIGGSNNKTSLYNNIKLEMPYIKENVILYTNSKVLGPLVVGKNTILAVNSLLTKNAPDDCIVMNTNSFNIKKR